MAIALLFLLTLNKNLKLLGASFLFIFIAMNIALLFINDEKINNVSSTSPNFKHVLSIKVDPETRKAVYYRTYFGVFARARETLPYETTGPFTIEWLAKDVGAVTYKSTDQRIHQYIATYGDRGNGSSYYHVGPSIQGTWESKNFQVDSQPSGITITENGNSETYDWKEIVQFGTLAIVLTDYYQAEWTIALGDDFTVDSDASSPAKGEIVLYKATTKKSKPIILHYVNKSFD